MKFYAVFILITFLCGCELVDEDSSKSEGDISQSLTLEDIDLSGTWLLTQERRETKLATNEYLSSDFSKSKYVFEDTDRGVIFSECNTYGDFYSPYGIKTALHFYMNIHDNGFELQSDGRLQQITVYEFEYNPGFSYEYILTLTKLSEEVEIDNGTLVIRGPLLVEEYSQVCVQESTSNIGNNRSFQLSVPYDDGYLSFNIGLIGNVSEGIHTYDGYYNEKEVGIHIYSNATLVEEKISAGIDYKYVTVDVVVSNYDTLSGSFVIIDGNDIEHSGEFEILSNN